MIKTYLILIVAIFFEVGGTMLLPVSQNFTKIIPTTTLAVFYLLSFYLITFVVDKIPIAIVYATWSGLGVFTVAILGYVFFKQSLSWQAVLGLFFIVWTVHEFTIGGSIITNISIIGIGSITLGSILTMTSILLYSLVSVVRERR